MKTINITRIPLLTMGFLGALMIMSATDTLAQRRANRGTPQQRRIVKELPDGYETLAMRGEAELYFHEGLIYKADPETDTYTIVGPPGRGGQGQARFSRAGHRGNAVYSRTGRRGSANYRNSGVRDGSGFRNQGFRGNASIQRHGRRNGSGFDGGSRFQGRQIRSDRRDIEPQGWRRDGRL